MKTIFLHFAIVFVLAAELLTAAESKPPKPPKPPEPPVNEEPKKPAAPARPVKVRVVAPYLHVTRPGGARGKDEKLPKLVVLGTTNTTPTTAESPVLYFQTTGSAAVPVFFTLTLTPAGADPARANAPLVEARVGQAAAGVYAIDLREAGIRLAAGESYEWSLATAADGQTTARDIVALGRIRYQPATAKLQAERERAAAGSRHEVYLRHKLFYDALAALLPLLEKQPGEPRLNADLNRVLKEIGVVRSDLAAGSGARP